MTCRLHHLRLAATPTITAELIAALGALIAAVEAGKGGDEVGHYAARVFNPGYAHAVNAYHGSFDAALAAIKEPKT